MNERINELKRQASIWCDQNIPGEFDEDIGSYGYHWEDKFAELIVRECVKLCEHESNDDEYDQYDMGMSVKAEDIKASIMKTFGVK